MVEYIGNFGVPGDATLPAAYRICFPSNAETKWYIVIDGNERMPVEYLSAGILKLSPYTLWSYPLLKERVETGWRLEDWK